MDDWNLVERSEITLSRIIEVARVALEADADALRELLTSDEAVEAACVADMERFMADTGRDRWSTQEAVAVYGESNRKLLEAVAARLASSKTSESRT